MKKVSNRSFAALVLTALLLVGLLAFGVRYAVKGSSWVVFPGSPHVYSGGNLNSGVVTDRDGVVLLDSTDGRKYADDAAVRKATLHLLGDREGYIAAPVLREYADELVGYDPFTGVYSLSGKSSTARLTISAKVQTTALAALNGRSGTVGVYNYRTGEILCAVSSPTYDPDKVPNIAGDTSGAYDGVYVNRFFGATFTPGSIFKLVTTAAALENIGDIEKQTFDCKGFYEVEGDKVICSGTHGKIDLKSALAHSCNVAFGQISEELGKKTLTEYADKLGLTKSLTLDGITAAAGYFDLTKAPEVDVAWSGIGQYTDLINPCTYLRYMGVIAGGGKAAEPYLMQEVRSKKLTSSYKAATTYTGQLLEASTCKTLSAMMHNNVETVYGAGKFPNLYVCAKSGTAEVGGEEMPHATFAGFIQDENYPLAFIVVAENSGSGSAVCASIAGTVLKQCVAVMDAEAKSK